MRVAVFGASGMVGKAVLLECLDDARITSVLVVGRRSCGVTHPKIEEAIHQNFYDFSPLRSRLASLDACFFCLGTTSAGKTEEDYTRQTYDLTLAAARDIVEASPQSVFVYVSGIGRTRLSAAGSCGRASRGGRRTRFSRSRFALRT